MSSPRPTALVTGANGYIGHAVARAFVLAGYTTYGLIRKPSAASTLTEHEIIPIIGTPDDLSFIPALHAHTSTFNVIASVTEDLANYIPHFNNIISLLLALSEKSNSAGIKPFVLFTSGCKDYGSTPLHNTPNLAPHTESSPLHPPAPVAARTASAPQVFAYAHAFDAVVTRPSTLFGYSSSFYGPAFARAAAAAADGAPLVVCADADSIMHGTHVDDVGAAYVALAGAPRERTAGQCYNVAAEQYETVRDVAGALAREYGIEEVRCEGQQGDAFDFEKLFWGFSQWVGSEKLRRDTGWREVRGVFSERVGLYRRAYEAAEEKGHENILRIRGFKDVLDAK